MARTRPSYTGAPRATWTRSSRAPGGRPTHAAAGLLRARDGRQGPRPHPPAVAAGAGGSGDRSMRTAVGSRHTTTVQPAVTVHQPSIRAREAAHDVVFDRRRSWDRRGWASQSVGRSRATINHPENARTGTVAVRPPGSSRRSRPRLHRNARRLEARTLGTASAAELVVVNLIAQHDVAVS